MAVVEQNKPTENGLEMVKQCKKLHAVFGSTVTLFLLFHASPLQNLNFLSSYSLAIIKEKKKKLKKLLWVVASN